MVTREDFWGRKYKLVASTEQRVSTVLMAIRRLDDKLSKAKRPRITKIKKVEKIEQEDYSKYADFEDNLVRQIREFKRKKQLVV